MWSPCRVMTFTVWWGWAIAKSLHCVRRQEGDHKGRPYIIAEVGRAAARSFAACTSGGHRLSS